MLVAIAMVMGVGYASAAEEAIVKMTYISGSDNDLDTSFGEVTSCPAGYNKISGGQVALANAGWGVNYVVYVQVDARDIAGYVSKATMNFTTDAFSARNTTWGVGYNSSAWSSDLTWNTADKSITLLGETQTVSKGQTGNLTFDITAAFANDEDKLVTILVYETMAGGPTMNLPTVTIEATTAPTAQFTIKYVDGDGNTLKSNRSAAGEIGGIPPLSDDDTKDFWANGIKYTYGSDDAENQQVASDGSTVVTITFVEAPKYGYTFTTSYTDGDNQVTLPFEATGEYYANENVTIFYPLKQTLNGRLYSKPINNNNVSQGYLLEYNNYSANQTYTDDNVDGEVIFLKEGEEIESLTKTVDNGYCNTRFSKGYGGYVETESADIIDLGPGTYVLTARVSGATPFVFTLSDGTEILSAVSSGNYLSEVSSEAFTVAGSTTIKVAQNGNAGSTSKIPVSIDYILVRQVPQTFSYTVNADLGMTLAEGTGYEGSTVTVNLPKYIWNEQTFELKGIGGPNSDRQSFTHSFELTTNGQEEVVEYTKANLGGVVFFAEGEDIDGLTKASGFYTNGRFSKGAGGYPENTVQLCTIDAGEYIFVASTNGDFVFSTSNGDILTTVDTSNAVNEHASESFTVYGPTAISVSGTGSAGSSGKMAKAIDFIYVQESASVGVKGVKSFESKDNAIYNLAGQEVKSASKGIFIKNGKKVVK